MSRQTLVVHVSQSGNDSWTGTTAMSLGDGVNGPVATLAGARDLLRRLRESSPASENELRSEVLVQIQSGTYELPETLVFSPRDGGCASFPVRYVAAEGATPVLSGGRKLRVDREVRHNGLRAWVTDLPDVAAGNWNFTRLYVNGVGRERPRLPRDGFFRFTGLAGCEDSGSDWGQGPDRANFRKGDIRRWHNWQDTELVSYQLWFDTHHRFKFIDEENETVYFHAQSLGSLRDELKDYARYYVDNVFEALDTPGQWYLDRAQGRLYYLPLEGERLEFAEIIAPKLDCLMRIQGHEERSASHLFFENLSFAHQQWEMPVSKSGYIQAAFGVPGAIILEGAAHCVFYGCTMAHLNGYGVEVLAGSAENTLAACTIYDAGAGGIKIGHEQLEPHQSQVGEELSGDYPVMETTVADCIVRDCGHTFPSAIGIWIGNSGWNQLVHNSIYNCNYTGISCGWTWGYGPNRTVANRIEGNHIHHINARALLSDNGGIYTLGEQPGTVVRGNCIHDISCYGYGAWGIYPDEGSSEILFENNLISGTARAAFFVHYGRDILVQNNIFALSKSEHLHHERREAHRTTLLRRNVILAGTGQIKGKWELPYLTAHDNLYWVQDHSPLTFNGADLTELQAQGQNLGAVVADPLFLDAPGGNFAMREDSPALRTGFEHFPLCAAGVRLGSERPRNYSDYVDLLPVLKLEIPVIRTRVQLVTPKFELNPGVQAEFAVTLKNVGRVRGQGSVGLTSGPTQAVERPDVAQFSYSLPPGEEMTQRVRVPIKDCEHTFWLDTEPVGQGALPARGLVILGRTWAIPRVANINRPELIEVALESETARAIKGNGIIVAQAKMAANEEGLILWLDYKSLELQPNEISPWEGTGVELIFPSPAQSDFGSEASSGHDSPGRQQLFLVPSFAGTDLLCLKLDQHNNVVPDREILARIRSHGAGHIMEAIIPWSSVNRTKIVSEFPFQIVVDTIDPSSGAIFQSAAFDAVSDAGISDHGKLEIAS